VVKLEITPSMTIYKVHDDD